MFNLSNFSKAMLMAASFLLITGCNDDNEITSATAIQSNETTSPQVVSTPEDTNGLKSLVLTIDKITLNKDEKVLK